MSAQGADMKLWIPGDPDADRYWLGAAIDLSRRCRPSESAFSVGAILVSDSGQVIATGYSRESDPNDHAEEVTLRNALAGAESVAGAKAVPGAEARAGAEARVGAAADPLARSTLYSSLEPCSARASRPVSCARLIMDSCVRRVVIAWREPPLFQPGGGAAWLAAHGITVVEIPDLAAEAEAVNAHLLAR